MASKPGEEVHSLLLCLLFVPHVERALEDWTPKLQSNADGKIPAASNAASCRLTLSRSMMDRMMSSGRSARVLLVDARHVCCVSS